jgi:hypothetical protein
MPPPVPDPHSLVPTSTSGLGWASQQSGELIGTCGQWPSNPQPRSTMDFIAWKLIPAGIPPQAKGGRTAQKGSPPRRIPAFRRRSGCIPAEPYPPLKREELIPCSESRATAPSHNRQVNFGASAPGARPHKTGLARPARKGRRSGSRLQFEWIASGLTAVSFWTAPRRLIAGLEGQVRSGSRRAPPRPIESE